MKTDNYLAEFAETWCGRLLSPLGLFFAKNRPRPRKKLLVFFVPIIIPFFALLIIFCTAIDAKTINIPGTITRAQPLSGLVLWHDNEDFNDTDAVSLEYAYIRYSDIVKNNGQYNWQSLEDKLNAIAKRKHQAIFRFYFVYPGKKTTVPQYIKAMPDYQESKGKTEGQATWFPDWRHKALQTFTLDFFTAFAKRYEKDTRLAYLQVGFGLWGEYHIYEGPFVLGKTFPDKVFQKTFFKHLHNTLKNIPWSVSVDASNPKYSALKENPDLMPLGFGLFDDSFMCKEHADYNTDCWKFFSHLTRSQNNPAGGELSYYTDHDQRHALRPHKGAHGESYESFAKRFHITYMIANDQPKHHSMKRLKQASIASGYTFTLKHCKVMNNSVIITMANTGTAPIYYDAYVTINNVRAEDSLKQLLPGQSKDYLIENISTTAVKLTISCDHLVEGQSIEFIGTQKK